MTSRTDGRREPIRWRTVKLLVAVAVAVPVAAVACLLAGLSPLLPVLLAAFGLLAVCRVPGLAYVFVVLNAPLGLRFVGVEGLVGDAFGGRDYALGLSAVAVVCSLTLLTVLRGGWRRAQVVTAVLTLLVLLVWSLIGIAHHGPAQTLVGLRLTVLPLLLLLVVAASPRGRVTALITVAAWLMVANALATVAELAVGPARLVRWGFEEGRAVRYIGDTFRAPGLTEFNAELGILAGAYLLGYVALWLTPAARPTRWAWHVGALSAVVCLALSTSRSGALLVVGGVVAAAVANRSGSAGARRRARLVGLGVVAAVAVGFVAVGATGARSLFQRFDVWSGLLSEDLPLWGRGIGAVGAATVSRVASGQQVFVDNYFVSVALQYGLPMMVALLGGTGFLLARLWRRSAEHPSAVPLIAVLVGLCGASLVVEAWEYPGAMMCLAIFAGYGLRLDAGVAAAGAGHSAPRPRAAGAHGPAPRPAVDADTVVLPPVGNAPRRSAQAPPERRRPTGPGPARPPSADADTVVLRPVDADTVVLRPVDADTVVLPPVGTGRHRSTESAPGRRAPDGGAPTRRSPTDGAPAPRPPADADTVVMPAVEPTERPVDDPWRR
ncbi:O-antigen ligase family protein [Micromonospora sp. CPCC 205561]|uniref:O-antigen ligase family protein n=1 Tax=Micromonospora sp. CPCC 205561 TaxID=3122407 RepID=UPI002FF22DD6